MTSFNMSSFSASNKFNTTVAYQSVGPEMEEAHKPRSDSVREKVEMGGHPQIAEKHGWLSKCFIQLLGLAWLVSVVALLYLNFTEYIIGASAWCPGGHCWLDGFNPVTSVPQRNMHKYDRDDHNLLGGLQFVAKALEVWFGIVATSFVYLVTMHFAGKKEGLPIGYLTRPSEFADVLSVFDKLFWMTGPSPFGNKSSGQKKLGRRVWALIALCVFLCILSNLMGPATAVLVIPSLQWIETKKWPSRTYLNSNAGQPPTTHGAFWHNYGHVGECTEAEFAAQNYSCTLYNNGFNLDAWLDSYIASGDYYQGYTSEQGLTFTANDTSQAKTTNAIQAIEKGFKDVIYWAPSRQIIGNLSVDKNVIEDLSLGFNEHETAVSLYKAQAYADPVSTYAEYNKSLELNLQRDGPVTGMVAERWLADNGYNRWTVDVDATRSIRCYAYYQLRWTPLAEDTSYGNYTKCIRIGSGWSETNKRATFSVPGAYDPVEGVQGLGAEVEIVSSDRAVFLHNGELPSWLPPACLSDGNLLNHTTCDWNRLFAYNASSRVANRTQNINTLEFTRKNKTESMVWAVDFVAYHAFTTYSLDPEPFSNPLGLVQTQDLPYYGTSFPIDPAWILAGWAVGNGGLLQSNRTTTNTLLGVMGQLFAEDEFVDTRMDLIAFLPIMQTLSIIDHTVAVLDKPPDSAEQPTLFRNARMYVWSYGMTSRTAYLGAIVAILGCLVVVVQFVLGFTDRREMRSATQLLVAALEHSPRAEFEGKQHNEVEMARTRFHIKDDNVRTGKFSFYEPDSCG